VNYALLLPPLRSPDTIFEKIPLKNLESRLEKEILETILKTSEMILKKFLVIFRQYPEMILKNS